MIRSFKDKEAKKIFNRISSKKTSVELQRKILMKLVMLDSANTINDLRAPPSNYLEKLKGTRRNQYSIRVNNQWRICFTWENNNANNVEIVDYH